MDKINMREAIDHDRRSFFGVAALTFTAAELGVIGAARAETNPGPLSVIKPGTNTSFGPLKQIDCSARSMFFASDRGSQTTVSTSCDLGGRPRLQPSLGPFARQILIIAGDHSFGVA